jgi:Ca-activated chloride channel homolog
MNCVARLTALALMLGALGFPARAQDETTQAGIEAVDVFLPIMVYDEDDRLMTGLTQRNFRVFEDGVEQKIETFEAPTQLPLQVAILMDTSSSVRRKLKFQQDAAADFVLSVLRGTTDRALFGTFDDDVELLIDFTSNTGDLTRAIDRVKAKGDTRLFDAVYRVCEEKMAQLPAQARPVMVVITDGADTASDRSLEEAIRIAQRMNVVVFGISTRNFSDISAGTVRGSVDKELARLCEETGGRTFLPYQRIELARAFGSIRDDLRSQYVIFYSPTNQKRDGKFRKIEVKLQGVDGKYKVRAKRGYEALAAGTP